MVLDSMAPARRFFVLTLICGAVGAIVALVAVLVIGRSSGDEVTPVAQDEPGPVLLVPGYGGSTASLSFLRDTLEKAGRTAVLVKPPGDGAGDIRQQAANLSSAVKAELATTHAASVDIVGYSAGGVVLRYYVAKLGGGDFVRRALTLSSPHHGTAVADTAAELTGAACEEACQQLTTDGEFLADLNRGDESPPGPQWVAIWTSSDKTVVPPESGELAGALSYSVQSVCPGLDVEHADMPSTPAVEKMVLAELGVALPRTPPASVCG